MTEDVPTAMPRTGVIGLGVIGAGVAVSLAKSGVPPTAVFDVRPGAADGLDGVPAQVGSPSEVADACDVVLLAVVNASQAHDVLVGKEGLFATGRDGLTVVLLSTVSIESVHVLAALCAEHGAVLLDAGVTGGGRAADNGLVIMVGGPDDAVERAMPVLNAFGKAVIHCGAQGTGMVAKLARNAITYGQWAVIREAASLAAAGDVPLERLLNVMIEGDDDGADRLTWLKILVKGIELPESHVDSIDALAQKDLAAAQHFAGSAGLQTPAIDLTRANIRSVYRGELDQPLPEDRRARGLAMMERAYGPEFSRQLPSDAIDGVPSRRETIDQLLGQVWARPYLTLRDRRLLTIGMTAMLGRADLLEVQLRGALINRELTIEQFRELALHGHYYAGWGTGTVLNGVVEKLIADLESAHLDDVLRFAEDDGRGDQRDERRVTDERVGH